MTTLTKNILDWLEKKYIKPTIALAEQADDENYKEKLDEIEQILKDALDYVQTLKK
jgi:anaerobic ribonucleoside-triphosphate reductase